MKFTKITIFIKGYSESDVDIFTSKLSDLGAEGFEIGGGAEIRDLIASADPDMIDNDVIQSADLPLTVTVYIPDNEQGRQIKHDIINHVYAVEHLEYTTDSVAEADWENNWKQYFKPIEIGERLVIKPSWEEYENGGNRRILEIDPASAFGTGQHATTRLCLELLEAHICGGESVLDIGCGSGILSAAAMILGAERAAAVDISENAVRITEETFFRNKIADYAVYCGDIINDAALRSEIARGGFSVVVANITADVIIAMADFFGEFLSESSEGVLFLSGIITPRLDEVAASLEKNFDISQNHESEGWVALVCHKK